MNRQQMIFPAKNTLGFHFLWRTTNRTILGRKLRSFPWQFEPSIYMKKKMSKNTQKNMVRGIRQICVGYSTDFGGRVWRTVFFDFLPFRKSSSRKKTTNQKENVFLFFYWRMKEGTPTLPIIIIKTRKLRSNLLFFCTFLKI